jgi:hypothetical protein
MFAFAVIPQMGGWTLRNGQITKSGYMVLNELLACQPTDTKVEQKKKKKKKNLTGQIICRVFHIVSSKVEKVFGNFF